jgi:FG-GAP repeat
MRHRSRRVAAWLAATLVVLATAGGARATGPLPVGGTVDVTRADLQVTGTASGDDTGRAVAFVGDVNHDGAPDLAIAAPNASPGARSHAGTVSVLLNRQGSAVTLGDPSVAVMRIDGPVPNARIGRSVAGLGDVNGDGIDDLAIGVPGLYYAGRTGSGTVFVVYGSTDPSPVDLANLGARGYRIRGPLAGDGLGAAVAKVPDVDGDGRAEIALGAPGADPGGRASAGSVFVLLSAREPSTVVDLATPAWPGWRIDGPAPSARAGSSLADAGDVNGDGASDLLVGAPSAPAAAGATGAYVVWARAPNQGSIDLAALGSGGIALLGVPGDAAGTSVAGVGDVNGDGHADVAIGAYRASANGLAQSGSVYVVYGSATPGSLALAATPAMGVRLDGASPADQLGLSVSSAGDVDGDGAPDLLVGANGEDPLGRPNAGGAYVVFGLATPGVVDLGLAGRRTVRLAGVNVRDFIGNAVAGGSVTDADGHPVLVVAGYHAGAPDIGKPGRVWVMTVPGLPPPLPPPAPRACATGAKNVEVLIDDSGSMRNNDPALLRRQALELMLSKPGNVGRLLGAEEFGSRAQEIFPPLVIALAGFDQQRDTILGLLTEHISANAGQTNYTAAFTESQLLNPTSDAQILLTDGYHNVGPDLSTSIARVPTYTVGFGRVTPYNSGGRRLSQIAQVTGGQAFIGVTAADLQPVLNHIDSLFACETPFRTTPTDAAGPSSGNAPATVPAVISNAEPTATFQSVVPPAAIRLPATAEMVLSWTSDKVRLDADSIRFRYGRRTALKISAAKLRRAAAGLPTSAGRVHFRGSRGGTFVAFRFTGLDHIRAVGAQAAARSPWRITVHITNHHHKHKHKHHSPRKARSSASPPARVRAYTQWYGRITLR